MENNKKLISNIIKAANKINKNNRKAKANFVQVPIENIEALSKKLNLSELKTIQLLDNYF